MRQTPRAAAAAMVTMTVGGAYAIAGDAVQWRVEAGGNGHWYMAAMPPGPSCFMARVADATRLGSHLATINIPGEQQFLLEVAASSASPQSCYVGGSRAPGTDLGTGWSWVTGEPFDPSVLQWAPGNPGCCDPNEYWLGVGYGGLHDFVDCNPVASILEWDADCDSNGIVDFGEIRAGTKSDENSNNVPDACECDSAPELEACCPADLNGDGVVSGADLGALVALWGQSPGDSRADLNGDGLINGADIGKMLTRWGNCDAIGVPPWATLLEKLPDPTVVTDPSLRQAIVATGLPWRVRDTGTGIEMLLVPPGTFTMGCGERSEQFDCRHESLPAHAVTLTRPYYLGRYEVKQSEWESRTGTNPSLFRFAPDSPTRPVESVDWSMIQGYLQGTGMRLPSEAEWEFACRAGTSSPFHNGSSDDSTVAALAWLAENSGGETHQVGTKQANALGLHDMHGNVFEWVNDFADFFQASPQVDPAGPVHGSVHLLRGGSWNYGTEWCNSHSRTWVTQCACSDYGFRVARDP